MGGRGKAAKWVGNSNPNITYRHTCGGRRGRA